MSPKNVSKQSSIKRSHIISLAEILKHESIIENISDGFQALGSDWKYLYVNKKAEKLIHVNRTAIVGKNIWKLYPHLIGTKFEKEYKTAVEKQVIREFDAFSTRLNKHFRVRAVPIFEGLLIYFNDVTREKKNERLLEYQKLLLDAQKEVSPEGILIVSESGSVFSYNTRFAKMWNLPDKVMKTKLDDTLLQAARKQLKDPEGFIKRVGEVYQTKKKSHDMLYFKNGKVFDRHGSPIIGKSGRYYGYVWFFLDITEREKAIIRLSEQDERKDEFINMASHELRTPITSLTLYTEFLKKKLAKDKDLRAHVIKMDQQVWRMSDLIKDMLDLSRIQTGKLIYRDERFSLPALAEEVRETMQNTTGHKKIILKPYKDIFVTGDRGRIGQVLINFISNAIKYSRRNSEIIISLERGKKSVTVSVQDFGMGISKEHQERIFERFYQVVEPTSKTYPGLGIGLHISSEIIKRHKGTIGVDSIKGKGSTFYFSLPLSK